MQLLVRNRMYKSQEAAIVCVPTIAYSDAGHRATRMERPTCRSYQLGRVEYKILLLLLLLLLSLQAEEPSCVLLCRVKQWLSGDKRG